MARLALFRADASFHIGSGHMRRCLAIARALRGWQCRFAVNDESPAIVPELTSGEFDIRTLPPGAGRDPAALAAFAPDGCDLFVVDHYGMERAYESSVKARQVLTIDDLADRPHDCHVLVDSTPGRNPADYRDLVPADTALLTGGAYAPLRPAFVTQRGRRRGRKSGRRLLINFGGTDPKNATGQVLDTLSASARLEGLQIDVIVGRGMAHADAIADRFARSTFVKLHIDPREPAEIMAACDLAIGAGGVGALERCAIGLPSVLVVIADNQRLVAEGIVRSRGGILADDEMHAARLSLDLLANPGELDRMGSAAMSVCDGRGAARIALWVDPGTAADGRPVQMRPAMAADEQRILAWQNQPDTRRYARDPRIPTAAEHHKWFSARLTDTDCLFNIVLHGSEEVGIVRLDRNDRGYEISINIDAACQKQGIGGAALPLARRLVPETPLYAHVKEENIASRALFSRAGYQPEGSWLVSQPLQ